MWRRPCTMLVREAWYAGSAALRKPTNPATSMATSHRPGVIFRGKKLKNCGEWVAMYTSKYAMVVPTSPPSKARVTASPTNMHNTVCRVKPSVFRTATSRVRSRIDIAIVFAETSKVAKTTAKQILRMKALTLPIMATNSRPNAFSLSAFVGWGELRNMSSIEVLTLLTSAAVAARILKVPARPLNQETASSTYFALKYTDLLSGLEVKMPRMLRSRFTG